MAATWGVTMKRAILFPYASLISRSSLHSLGRVAIVGPQQSQQPSVQSRPFSSTSPTLALLTKQYKLKPNPNSKRRNEHAQQDQRIVNLHRGLSMVKFMPPPLRMARNRHLRHWTIHRAWLLLRRQQREARQRTLMRQWQSMNNACEELRKTSGPGPRSEGYLYRVAMEKHGVYGHNGIPIEYARAQTETPARIAWDHDWKR